MMQQFSKGVIFQLSLISTLLTTNNHFTKSTRGNACACFFYSVKNIMVSKTYQEKHLKNTHRYYKINGELSQYI